MQIENRELTAADVGGKVTYIPKTGQHDVMKAIQQASDQ